MEQNFDLDGVFPTFDSQENFVFVDPKTLQIIDDGKPIDGLIASIQEFGLLEAPLTCGKKVIHGNRRVRAAVELGYMTIPVRMIPQSQAEIAPIIERLVRRQQTVMRNADDTLALKHHYENQHPDTKVGGKKVKGKQNPNLGFCKLVAHITDNHISKSAVAMLIQIAEGLLSESRQLIHEAQQIAHQKGGKKKNESLANNQTKLMALSKISHDIQVDVTHEVIAHPIWSVKMAEEEARRKKKASSKNNLSDEGEKHKLILGDCLKVMPTMADESFDLILTDVPYENDYLPMWKPWGKECQRLLKPHGLLMAMMGQMFLPQFIADVRESLHYYWETPVLHGTFDSKGKWHPKTHGFPIKGRKIATLWRPFVLFTKEKPFDWPGPTRQDIIYGGGSSKIYHKWGQSLEEFLKPVEWYCPPDGHILEPFCGGGTTVIAALKLGRKVTAIDNDPFAIATTKKRIEQLAFENEWEPKGDV